MFKKLYIFNKLYFIFTKYNLIFYEFFFNGWINNFYIKEFFYRNNALDLIKNGGFFFILRKLLYNLELSNEKIIANSDEEKYDQKNYGQTLILISRKEFLGFLYFYNNSKTKLKKKYREQYLEFLLWDKW
jgi:hypothetical protein